MTFNPSMYAVVYWQDNLHIALALIIPPWLYIRLRVAGAWLGALYCWQLLLYAEMGLPTLAPVHDWHNEFLIVWLYWGWLFSLAYIALWYGFIRLLEVLWFSPKKLPPLPPAPNALRLNAVERVSVILVLGYLVTVIAIMVWLR